MNDTAPSFDDLLNDANRAHELLYALRHANDGFALSVLKDGSWVVWRPLDAKYAAAAEPDEYLVTIPLPELATVTPQGATNPAEANNAAALKASDERTTGEDASLSLAPADTPRTHPALTHDTMREAQFLLDRLADFELALDERGLPSLWREWNGHVTPAISRMRAALSPQPQVTEEELVELLWRTGAEHQGMNALETPPSVCTALARAIIARLTGGEK